MTAKERREKEWLARQLKAEGDYYTKIASDACAKASEKFQRASELTREIAEADRPKLRVIDGKAQT